MVRRRGEDPVQTYAGRTRPSDQPSSGGVDEAAEVFLDQASAVTRWSRVWEGWWGAGVGVPGGGGDLDGISGIAGVAGPGRAGSGCGGPAGGLFGVVAGLAESLPVRRGRRAALGLGDDVVGVPDRGPAPRCPADPVPDRQQ